MKLRHVGAIAMVVALTSSGWRVLPAQAQGSPGRGTADAQDAARKKIMESDRWRRGEQKFNEWLAVQSIYSPDEVTEIRAEMAESVAKMSPSELDSFMKEMEDRLVVLTSPEAKDARLWLEQFMAVARNPEQQLGLSRPDVLNLSANQIRHELSRLQQVRESRLQQQAAFDRSRTNQMQATRDAQVVRDATRPPSPNRSNWPANTPQGRSQRTQRRDPLPPPFRPPVYTVSPWGTPIIWHP